MESENKQPLTQKQIDYLWMTLEFTGSVAFAVKLGARIFKKNVNTVRNYLKDYK